MVIEKAAQEEGYTKLSIEDTIDGYIPPTIDTNKDEEGATWEDAANVSSPFGIPYNNPELAYKASWAQGGVDINDPTYKKLLEEAKDPGTKKALYEATSIEHALAISETRKEQEESTERLNNEPLAVNLGMQLTMSMASPSTLLPLGLIGNTAKLGGRVNKIVKGVGAGAVGGAVANTLDEAAFDAQGMHYNYLTAAAIGMGFGGILGGIGGALDGVNAETHAFNLSKDGDTFTKDFERDPNIITTIKDGVLKISPTVPDKQRKGWIDHIPALGKWFKSDVNHVLQSDSSILRGEMLKWASGTIANRDNEGNVIPTQWNAQNDKSIAKGYYNTLIMNTKEEHRKAVESGYKGTYDEYVKDVSKTYTNAITKQESIVYNKLKQSIDDITAKYKAEKKARQDEHDSTQEAFVIEKDGTHRPMTEEEYIATTEGVEGAIPEGRIAIKGKTKKQKAEFKKQLDKEYDTAMREEITATRDKLYSENEVKFEGADSIVAGSEHYREYYKSMLNEARASKVSGVENIPNGRLYRPRVWDFEQARKLPEAEVRAILTKAISSHPQQSGATADDIYKMVDHVYKNLQSKAFDLDNLTTTFVAPKELPFEGMLKNKKIKVDESLLGPLLKDHLGDVSGAYSFKMSGRIAGSKVLDGKDINEYVKELSDKLISEGKYTHDELKALVRIIEDTFSTLRMNQQGNTPGWQFARTLGSYNSLRLGGGFGGNQFIELASNLVMNGITSLVNGRFSSTWKNAGAMLYKGKAPDDELLQSMIASGYLDTALHDHRINRYADTEAGLNPGLIENTMNGLNNKMMNINGMKYFTAVMEDQAGGYIMTNISRMANKSKLTYIEEARLARWGMTHQEAKELSKDMDMYYNPKEGRLELNKFSENNRQKFQQAIQNGLDEIIIQGDSIHLPNWMKAPTPIVRLLTQFMRFPMVAQETLLRRGMREDQARFVGGIVASTITYMGLKYIREQASIAAGFTDKTDAKYDYFDKHFGDEAIKRAILGSFNYNANLGFMSSLVNYAALATGNPSLGKDYQYDKGVSALLGPSGSLADDFIKMSSMGADMLAGKPVHSEKAQMILKSGTPFLSLPLISEGVNAFIKN